MGGVTVLRCRYYPKPWSSPKKRKGWNNKLTTIWFVLHLDLDSIFVRYFFVGFGMWLAENCIGWWHGSCWSLPTYLPIYLSGSACLLRPSAIIAIAITITITTDAAAAHTNSSPKTIWNFQSGQFPCFPSITHTPRPLSLSFTHLWLLFLNQSLKKLCMFVLKKCTSVCLGQ